MSVAGAGGGQGGARGRCGARGESHGELAGVARQPALQPISRRPTGRVPEHSVGPKECRWRFALLDNRLPSEHLAEDTGREGVACGLRREELSCVFERVPSD